jgi:hypothetical protein
MSQIQRTDDGYAGVRGARYGEILLAKVEGSTIAADVYTTFTLNECPDDLWQELDPGKVAADHGCDFALKNGPRYWLMDSIRRGPDGEFVLAEFGGIPMARIAVVRVDLSAQPSPGGPGGPLAYHQVRVDRKALFTFDAGRAVFELVDPTGAAFVMQAYCVAADPTLSESSLPGLEDRLALPEGWRFVTRTLDSPLAVDTRGQDAVVVQDELQNSYCQYR